METTATTSEIYNLIILDESGSMDCVWEQTISGCNETINTIKVAQEKFAKNQKHFVSIYAFQSRGDKPSRYLIKNMPADQVKHITKEDYEPCGSTPLNDALGMTLADLKATCKASNNAIGNVTIITDGEENSSREYSAGQVRDMIEKLKALGWSFSFIGANIDVKATAEKYDIDNTLEFKQDDKGMREMFERERTSRMCYYDRVEEVNVVCSCSCASEEDAKTTRAERLAKAAKGYFKS